MFGRKAQAGTIAVIIILIALIFLGWLVHLGGKECHSNRECPEDYYCGSDFNCHQYPAIQKVVRQVDYTKPALVIGVALILIFLAPKVLDFVKDVREQKLKYAEKAEPKEEPEKKVVKKTNNVYYNYPTYTSSHSVRKTKKVEKVKQETRKLFNNYVGVILAGLVALGIILATKLDYIGIAVFGAVLLFFIVYKLWSYCLEYNAEYYLIIILALIYVILSFIYFVKGGLFVLIGLGFLVVTFFAVKETISLVEYKTL